MMDSEWSDNDFKMVIIKKILQWAVMNIPETNKILQEPNGNLKKWKITRTNWTDVINTRMKDRGSSQQIRG